MLGTAWKRWNWLDEGLIPLAGALMTAAWGYPLFAAFLRDPKTGTLVAGYSFWLCLTILIAGLYPSFRLSSLKPVAMLTPQRQSSVPWLWRCVMRGNPTNWPQSSPAIRF